MEHTDRVTRCHLGLLALLWAELEAWVVTIRDGDPEHGSATGVPPERIEAFLLELALLHDCPDTFVLRRALGPDEATRLRNVVGDVWRLLDLRPFDTSPERVRLAAMRAQDRLFEELRDLARASTTAGEARAATDRSPAATRVQGTDIGQEDVCLARA